MKIMVEQVQPQDIRWLRGLRHRHGSAETASTFSLPGSFASVRTRPTGSLLQLPNFGRHEPVYQRWHRFFGQGYKWISGRA